MFTESPNQRAKMWELKPSIISPPLDARGIYVSRSKSSAVPSSKLCNLLVHSSSPLMARWPLVVPGLQGIVSMQGLVMGPKLMMSVQGTCCALRRSWAITPKGSPMSRLTCAESTCSLRTCKKYGSSHQPFTLTIVSTRIPH